jgi:hypothetical protein
VAGVNLEPAAAFPAQRPLELWLQELAATLIAVLAGSAMAQPALLLGAVPPFAWWALQRPPRLPSPPVWLRWLAAAAAALPAGALHAALVPGWAVRLAAAALAPALTAGAARPQVTVTSVSVEVLLGPLWFELALAAAALRTRSMGSAVVRNHRRETRRHRALIGQNPGPLHRPVSPRAEVDAGHPPGRIRLGLDAESRRPFDLDLAELAQHVFLPGASGSGKTTTLTRLADGALAAGYGVVIVDCKGGGLGGVARMLAVRYGVPFHLVDPDALDGSPDGSLGYDPCWGDPASVGNKLVGAFTYTGAAEVFKDAALEAIPLIVRALMAAGEPVTLKRLYDALGKGGMGNLARRVEHPLRGELEVLDRTGGVGQSGYIGLQRRLGALRQGKFGELFTAQPALDWEGVLATPSVTYLVLRATASSEDVDLMGRLIAQDLKQACARRFRQLENGETLTPVLAIFDEFAALREAEQIVDLLLQARQALMPTVVSVQYLPESIPIRGAVLGAGLLLAHRVAGPDAEEVATQFGTRRTAEVTNQIDFESGFSEKGSIRQVEQFIVHPNQLRNLQPGQAAVRSVAGQRNAIVRVLETR